MQRDSKPIPTSVSTHSIQMEQRRTILRKALERNPDSAEVKQALVRTLKLPYIQRAAERGVFISYHRNDELFALELDQNLRNAGVSIWLDAIDMADEIDWYGGIQRALQDCGVMLFILSPDSVADEDAQYERKHFIDSGKIIIPLLYQDCNLSGIEHIHVPPVDFRYDYQRGLKQLVQLFISSGEVSV